MHRPTLLAGLIMLSAILPINAYASDEDAKAKCMEMAEQDAVPSEDLNAYLAACMEANAGSGMPAEKSADN